MVLVDLVVGNVGPPSGATDDAAVDGPLENPEDSLVNGYEVGDADDVADEGLVEIEAVLGISDSEASLVELLEVGEADDAVVLD